MSARPRADLATLPGYVPGRTITGAIKLASNEVGAGPLPSVRAAIAEAAADINRYPDTNATALVDRLAARFGVPAERVVVGCGSVSLCQMLVQATCTPFDQVAYNWMSFEAYPISTHVAGARSIQVPLDAEYALDLDALLAAITPATRLVFVCTPNNPTGPAVRRAELERFLDAVPDDVLVVLDEAYREFVTDPEVPDGLTYTGRDNVAVLRTFSKAYGLAGLRVGFCVAPEPVAAALRKVAIPFAVNRLAQTAALASLDAEDELLARCRVIVGERTRVRDALLGNGFTVPRSESNFVWLPLGADTEAFSEHCLAHKVIVRAFSGQGCRVTVGEREENDTFLAAAASFRAGR